MNQLHSRIVNVPMKRNLRTPLVNSFKLNFADSQGFDLAPLGEGHNGKERYCTGELWGTHPCFIQSFPAFICFTALHSHFT